MGRAPNLLDFRRRQVKFSAFREEAAHAVAPYLYFLHGFQCLNTFQHSPLSGPTRRMILRVCNESMHRPTYCRAGPIASDSIFCVMCGFARIKATILSSVSLNYSATFSATTTSISTFVLSGRNDSESSGLSYPAFLQFSNSKKSAGCLEWPKRLCVTMRRMTPQKNERIPRHA